MFGLRNTVLFLLPVGAFARVGEDAYPLVERSLQTKEIDVTELKDFMLTFSFHSPPKQLKGFWIDLYDTDGWLPENSTNTVGNALSRFLIAEMNARYIHQNVKNLDVKFLAQSTITSSRRKWRRGLQSIGSELKTEVTVVFRNEPSPDVAEVDSLVSEVMGNLTFFIANLTDLGEGDQELAYINRAERKETGGFNESNFDDDDFVVPSNPDGIAGPASAPEDEGIGFAVLMTVVAGACVILASIALFSIRSRRQSKEIEDAPAGLGQINVFLGDDDEDDIFSFEAALIESPAVSAISRMSTSTNAQSQVSSDGSDVYSGIDSQLTSPRESKSVFSFLSGQKSEGSSTVVASNKTKDKTNYLHPNVPKSPKPKLASLLNFSEEEEEEDLESDASGEMNAPLVPGATLKAPEMLGTDDRNGLFVEKTEENGTTKVVGVAKVTFAEDVANTLEPASSNTTQSTLPLEPPSSIASVCPPAESFSSRWDNGVFPFANGNTCPRNTKETPGAEIISNVTVEAQPRDNGSRSESEVRRDFVSETAPADASDNGSSYEVNLPWNSPSEADQNAAMAAEFVHAAKNASQSKESANKSPSKASFRSPQSPKTPKSQKTPTGSPGFSPLGRRKSQKGRRHAKSTSADGSRNYQHETMQQKDEGLASFDAVSLSSDDSEHSSSERVPKTPQSATTPNSENKSFFSLSSEDSTSSDGTSGKRLLSDLVWLEKKIAGAANKNSSGGDMSDSGSGTPLNRKIDQMDSLSFASNDAGEEMSINTASPDRRPANEKPKGVSAIVCRDCFAPPGKLRIVIHSTKDGPAIHTVKSGSSLTGHVYPGDLIISVDDVDTRSFTAEQVMKMMTARNKYQRKITVLHFETEAK